MSANFEAKKVVVEDIKERIQKEQRRIQSFEKYFG